MNIKHLEVKRTYYNDPENVVVEVGDGDVWNTCKGEPTWFAECYRIKPRAICIGEIGVPEPVKEPLICGTHYYAADTSDEDFYMTLTWDDDVVDFMLKDRGLVHLTSEAAELHAKALILVSGGRIE